MTVDPVSIEVIRGALTYAAEEMGITLRKSAYSPNIKERMDFSCTIFDHERRLLTQAEHIPVHLGSMSWAVQEGLHKFKDEVEEGDMIIFNDPFISGTHLPDITLISPIFLDGRVLGYTANKAHHSDVGGVSPGSMAGDATELYQEGVIIPPVKFVSKGKINEALAKLIKSNVRTPEVMMGDLRAQIASNLLGERKVLEIARRYGVDVFHEASKEMMNYSERMMRNEINKMDEGSYEAEDFLEDTGVSDEPVKIRVTVTIQESSLKIDYTGTDKQVDGPINAVRGVTLAGVYYTLKCITDPNIHMNEGCYRPVEVYVPEGTILNPVPPAAVAGGNVETSQRNVDVLLKAFSKVVPKKVCAACQGTMNNVSIGGINPKTGKLWSFYETIAGGFGGRRGLDGVDAIHTHMTNTMNTPIEVVEGIYPLKFLKYEFREGSGGPGKWRGGVGLERSWMLLAPSATLSILAERNKFAPWGLFGGKPGAKGEFLIIRPDNTEIKLNSKCRVRMSKGDILLARTPGGGGYGSPIERDPRLVRGDVVNGLVSLASAKKDYGVVMRSGTMEIDWKATEEKRKKRL